jgi:glucose/arabinose dehydrogenase
MQGRDLPVLRRWHVALGALLALCLIPAMATAQSIALSPVLTGLARPLGITHAGDGSGRLFIVLQGGKILVHDAGGTSEFLDISSLVLCCGEQGLLGVAFHPNYASNGFFYVNYVNPANQTVIARYSVSANPDVANPNSGVPLLTVDHPYGNHKGGQIKFGPDGYLYIAIGDGGSAGDPENRAQNLGLLLGKLLRIDVDHGTPYAIPADNPFLTTPGAKPEIWAFGLRNPWRFSFDRQTGDLLIADVGQGAREEVNFQPAGASGGTNYGWRRMEGTLCYNPASGCNDGTLTLPVLEYDHSLGCSITGGYRYRGIQYPQFAGTYIYGDYCSGRIWGTTTLSGPGPWPNTLLLDTALNISTFGEDEAGELYVAHVNDTAGAIYRIVPLAGDNVIDNISPDTTFTGTWCVSTAGGFFDTYSLYSCGGGADTYRWTPIMPLQGTYAVYVWWTAHANRSTAVPISVVHANGTTTTSFNQQVGGGQWVLHGQYAFNAGTAGYVQVTDSAGQAAADAVKFVPVTADTVAPDTTITGGPTGTITTGNATFTWTGSDNVTPEANLVYAYRLDPLEPAFSAFGPATTKNYTNLANGSYTFHVKARDQAGNEDASPATRAFTVGAGTGGSEIVIDNGQVGTSATGQWCVSAATNFFGSNSLYSCGSAQDTYRWTPSIPSSGTYNVYVWWTSHANRSTAVPISVVHANGTTTTSFNQQVGGGQWVLHGQYTFNAGTAGYVQVSAANGQAAADAVRFIRVSTSGIVIDNGQAGTSLTGQWCVSAATNFFGTNSLYSCGSPQDTYRWTPSIPTTGTYSVYVWWSSHENRSSAVPIAVAHGNGTTTLTFNEKVGGGQWVLHGQYTFNAGTGGYVQVSAANGQAAADAVRWVPVP